MKNARLFQLILILTGNGQESCHSFALHDADVGTRVHSSEIQLQGRKKQWKNGTEHGKTKQQTKGETNKRRKEEGNDEREKGKRKEKTRKGNNEEKRKRDRKEGRKAVP
jgi:hypothetical protein